MKQRYKIYREALGDWESPNDTNYTDDGFCDYFFNMYNLEFSKKNFPELWAEGVRGVYMFSTNDLRIDALRHVLNKMRTSAIGLIHKHMKVITEMIVNDVYEQVDIDLEVEIINRLIEAYDIQPENRPNIIYNVEKN